MIIIESTQNRGIWHSKIQTKRISFMCRVVVLFFCSFWVTLGVLVTQMIPKQAKLRQFWSSGKHSIWVNSLASTLKLQDFRRHPMDFSQMVRSIIPPEQLDFRNEQFGELFLVHPDLRVPLPDPRWTNPLSESGITLVDAVYCIYTVNI